MNIHISTLPERTFQNIPSLEALVIIIGILQGDSGGPLTTVVKGQHVLIGDVSNGLACKGPYSIFGDVAHYRKWIDTTVYDNGGAVMCAA